METLKGFPILPAMVRAEQSSAARAALGTRHPPCHPRASRGLAHATMP